MYVTQPSGTTEFGCCPAVVPLLSRCLPNAKGGARAFCAFVVFVFVFVFAFVFAFVFVFV